VLNRERLNPQSSDSPFTSIVSFFSSSTINGLWYLLDVSLRQKERGGDWGDWGECGE
jgi:hypothetical protein